MQVFQKSLSILIGLEPWLIVMKIADVQAHSASLLGHAEPCQLVHLLFFILGDHWHKTFSDGGTWTAAKSFWGSLAQKGLRNAEVLIWGEPKQN